MPRDLPLGNGDYLVTFDSRYQLRDIYYPNVGQENHTVGDPSRFGVWVDGVFAWTGDDGWDRHITYEHETLVGDTTLVHSKLGLSLRFRDAVDYTRPDPDQGYAVIGAYMAHHLGMGLVALTNALTGQVWQRRFHADPVVRSAELLLHERIPRRLVLQEPQEDRLDQARPEADLYRPTVRQFDVVDMPQPHVALLGHLPYTIMVSHGGSGYSRYEALAVTRWHSDGTSDATGQFCYVKDLSTGRTWSAAHQPVCVPGLQLPGSTARVRLRIISRPRERPPLSDMWPKIGWVNEDDA